MKDSVEKRSIRDNIRVKREIDRSKIKCDTDVGKGKEKTQGRRNTHK